MNLVDLLKYISSNYEEQFEKPCNKENILNKTIKENINTVIPYQYLGHNITIDHSTGQGRWAYYPWITFFDKTITSTAQKGYYVVFLFTNDYKEVYLSLNQGWTYFQNEYKNKIGRENIKIVSDFWKEEIRDIEEEYNFSKEDISLDRNENRITELGKGYSLGNIISKHYVLDELTTEDNDNVISDLIEMINLLKDIKSKLINSVDPIALTNHKIIEGSTLSEIIEEKENSTIKNSESKKELLLTEKQYNKKVINNSKGQRISNIDHEAANRVKQFNGKQGEELVMDYERKRLKNDNQLKAFVDKIEHVSVTKGDGLGYDILSYDVIDGEVKEIYIEVKTVSGNINSPINISLKELKVAKQNKGQYKIYKVFDYKRKNPELLIIDDLENSSIYLEPSGYIIKVKPVEELI